MKSSLKRHSNTKSTFRREMNTPEDLTRVFKLYMSCAMIRRKHYLLNLTGHACVFLMKSEIVIDLIKGFPCPLEDSVVHTVNYTRFATAEPSLHSKKATLCTRELFFSSQINSVC